MVRLQSRLLLLRMEVLAATRTWPLGLSREHQPPKWGISDPSRAWMLSASLAAIITCREMRDKGSRQKDARMQAHRACASVFMGCLLSSSNVSSTTCHRQLSCRNSLSTRLTRK